MSNEERINENHNVEKNNGELDRINAERSREIHENLENKQERSNESVDEIKNEALEKAASNEREKTKDQEDRRVSPAERRTSGLGKAQRDTSYKMVMDETRIHMSAPSRTFSKVIHNKVVEKTSEVAGATIARPNAILSGSIFAFILTLGVYVVAKNIGYSLSGFETIGAFILGWVIGLLYDFFKVMITGRK